MFGYLLLNDESVGVIIEGKIEEREREEDRIEFSDELKQKVNVSSFKEIKELPMDLEELRRLHQRVDLK